MNPLNPPYQGEIAITPPIIRGGWEGLFRLPQAQAASDNPTLTYIKGNYNGMVTKTITGNIIYVLAVPSIVTNQTGTLIDVMTLSGKLLIHGKANTEGVGFSPVIVFSGASLPTNDTNSGITNLTTAIQKAYSGSVVSSHSAIKDVLNTMGGGNIVSLGSSIITNYL